MFKTYCFIRKNTPEIIQRLENLGWRFFTYDENTTSKNECIGCFLADKTMDYSVDYCRTLNEDFVNKYLTNTDGVIDCGDNEELFFAVAALRDDSNEHQWFIWDDYKNDGDRWKLYGDDPSWSWWIFEVHKATVPELVKHFIK